MKPKKAQNQNALEENFYQALTYLNSPEEARLFFEDLCTPNELQAMIDRWLIVPHLLEGKPYRSIHQETGISVTTIGRVARTLQTGKGGYQSLLTKLPKKN